MELSNELKLALTTVASQLRLEDDDGNVFNFEGAVGQLQEAVMKAASRLAQIEEALGGDGIFRFDESGKLDQAGVLFERIQEVLGKLDDTLSPQE